MIISAEGRSAGFGMSMLPSRSVASGEMSLGSLISLRAPQSEAIRAIMLEGSPHLLHGR